ncbi:PREDICTED: ADAM DEC1-like [Ceratosolen solmsi marchali]|uniref:ADAM DEC1-like n=1 Tax=Ceratosolen solmsi marchali TaxID=326594 RepID=A0AAJ7DYM1_9HYME|nr:PREDICTED: ADAM DEC1-like [Ceratosolen solmsi marchali]
MHFFINFLLINFVYAAHDFSSIKPKGLYTAEEHIHSHEIIFPRKVTHLGHLISPNVTHLSDGELHGLSAEMEDLYYDLTMGGNKYQLKLAPANSFIGRSMIVERHKREIRHRSAFKNHTTKCHYRGIIQNQPNSRVVLSTCDGLLLDNDVIWQKPRDL